MSSTSSMNLTSSISSKTTYPEEYPEMPASGGSNIYSGLDCDAFSSAFLDNLFLVSDEKNTVVRKVDDISSEQPASSASTPGESSEALDLGASLSRSAFTRYAKKKAVETQLDCLAALDDTSHGSGGEEDCFQQRRKVDANGVVRFEGTFKNGLKHGQGIKYCPLGKKQVVGVWEEGKPVRGEFFDPSGICRYRGALAEGGSHRRGIQAHGKGTFFSVEGHKTYEGEVHFGVRHWKGTAFCRPKPGTSVDEPDQCSSKSLQMFEGTWKNGKPVKRVCAKPKGKKQKGTKVCKLKQNNVSGIYKY